MNVDTPDTLLKSALEKIVYFEARSSQLSNDLAQARDDAERLRAELGQAAQREIDLRKIVAELEVRANRAHLEREELARLNDALRRERSDLIAKMLDASRLHQTEGLDNFDLAQFIAQLRSEVLLTRDGTPVTALATQPLPIRESVQETTASTAATRFGTELRSQGRLAVTEADVNSLTNGQAFPGRSEETLFGFSVRELASPDAASRIRAAERLTALAHPAAGPAIATALHAEVDARAQVALLTALSTLARAEALPVVKPLLAASSPDVRIAALKALIKLDPASAGPHLAAATKDPDKAVRRRASLLALGLSSRDAIDLGSVAIRDSDADVRSLAALVLGASPSETSRSLLLEAMRDPDARVRKSASQALSTVLGRDVTSLVGLDDAQRRREVRRLANPDELARLPKVASRTRQPPQREAPQAVAEQPSAAPASAQAEVAMPTVAIAAAAPVVHRPVSAPAVLTPTNALARSAVAVVEVATQTSSNDEFERVLTELRAAIRGKSLAELANGAGLSADQTLQACTHLLTQGAIVRRGLKYFVA